ncbi:MAG: hypothetical protein KGP28_03295 [Bdellovibrionales bacterium]|nr:hypothetical protein [Bdellovibrionales bacterium]
MKIAAKTFSLAETPHFPDRWSRLLDGTLPAFVKERFSPSESWKKKPFSKEDVNFFSKGLLELSEFFTSGRESDRLPNYFTTARFRSSYFLYFFGLQGAKFLTLFDRHPAAVDAALNHAVETGTLRILDVGAGPGTASIAFLCHALEKILKDQPIGKKDSKLRLPFSIELLWIDHNEAILKDGEQLLSRLLELFPEIDGSIGLTTQVRPWWKHPKGFSFDASLVLFGNVLNEGAPGAAVFQQGLAPFLKDPKGGGVLLLEPAFREPSQRLSSIRDEVMLSNSPLPIWGPCLHREKCPLSSGKNWCHFSVPAKLPGEFFRKFSIKLGGVRDWLKFSYVWFASKRSEDRATSPKGLVRVISDPIRTASGLRNLVCRPDRFTYEPTPKKPVFRGEVIHDPLFQPRHKNH